MFKWYPVKIPKFAKGFYDFNNLKVPDSRLPSIFCDAATPRSEGEKSGGDSVAGKV